MNPLKQKIIAKIKSGGPINFETFMGMALYYPVLGYYMKDSTKIGKAGDFYTGPHLHPIFGAMLGRQMEEMWNLLGRPDVFSVVEMGAGMGYLAKDMLEYLRKSERNCFRHVRYTIIELNPALGDRQRELLSEFGDRVGWVSGLKDLGPVTGCFLSNELFDAFPVRLIETDGGLMEIYLSVDENDDLIELRKPCEDSVKNYFEAYNIVISGAYRTEVNLLLEEFIRDLSSRISTGFVLTIDYGYPYWDYYSKDRSKGTLLCYYRHQVNEEPYLNIGDQDLTSHVNFSSLKRCGEQSGLKTIGFCPQGTYLVSLGLDEAMRELYGDRPDPFETAKIKGLILPQGMGKSHKVMIQYKGAGEPKLRGFAIRNETNKL